MLNEHLAQIPHPDCLSENVSISGLSDHQKLANACAKRNNNICKKHIYYPPTGCCAKRENAKVCNKQSRSIKIFENF